MFIYSFQSNTSNHIKIKDKLKNLKKITDLHYKIKVCVFYIYKNIPIKDLCPY